MTATPLTGWGRATTSTARVLDPPVTGAPPATVLSRGALARGMARSYGDAAQNAGGVVFDMTTRDRLHTFDADAGVVRVGAGATLDAVLRTVVPHGWFLPVTPGTRMITVGGAIAADVHGKNHPADGSIRRHLGGFTLLLADGTTRWVTPDDGDVFAATLGGMGLTGLILDAELTLRPITTTAVRTRTWTTGDLDATLAALDDSTAEYRIATLDLMRAGGRTGRAIVETAEHDEAVGTRRRAPLTFTPRRRMTVPDHLPNGMLNRVTARAFTEAWFTRAPRRPRDGRVTMDRYFYPLDALAHWNRLYGARGFVQYQFAVPTGREAGLRRIAERFATAGCPTFVVVLKRLGSGAGMLSFPIDGWTLAADIPVGVDGLVDLLEWCDDQVCEAGGRVYLAKDGRVRAERMPVMYPDLDRWRRVRDRLDPADTWRSDLGRRLGLCRT